MPKLILLRPSDRTYEIPYVSKTSIPRILLAGFAATFCMTLFTYLSPFLGIPNIDFAAILGAFLGEEQPVMFGTSWWLGLAWHFLNGSVIFPLIYAFWVYPVFNEDTSSVGVQRGFSRRSVLRAILWAVMLWALAQLVAMPLAGGGIFSTRTLTPWMVLVGSFLSHLVYGTLFGALTRVRQPDYVRLAQDRAA